MQLYLPLNKVPLTLIVGVRTKQKMNIKIEIKDNKKPDTYYVNRGAKVNGYREFNLPMPQSPKGAIFTMYNVANGNLPVNKDTSFVIEKFEVGQLKDCPIWMKKDTHSFVKFAQNFAENASILSAGKKRPHIYRSKDAKFHIDYYDKIIDHTTGKMLMTPARIGHQSGVIEVSKSDFMKYTVPMRMIILLHEYAHKYMNPDIAKPISYETGADINGLSVYLSLGYSPLEAHYAFLNVFRDANNANNTKRYKIIKDFIEKFTSGELSKCKMPTNERVKANKTR